MSTAPTQPATVPVVSAERLLTLNARVIDLRSPSEFAEDHVPGAHNVPLFDDTSRALVGWHYKQVSPESAFAEGRAIVAETIETLVRSVARVAGWDIKDEDFTARVHAMTANGIDGLAADLETFEATELPAKPVILHCWRGGLRSRSVVSFFRALGCEVFGLDGGYKSYRRRVIEGIASWEAPPAVVLRGLTGVGKTLVLRELERQRPGWTFDLELQAGHRSSLLGMVGLEPCTQKTFESRMYARICAGFPGPAVFEGESRKVGDALIPTHVWEVLTSGTNIELVAPVERRVEVLMEDYLATDANREPLRAQIAIVEARMQTKRPLLELFDAGRDADVTRELLEHYYDPLYRHGEERYPYSHQVDTTDPAQAAREIGEWIDSQLAGR